MSGEGTYVCTLDEETQKKALEELNEDPKQRASQIEALRQWIKAQPHLNSRTDDAFLLRFLRVAKFSQLRAQQVLDNFWSARSSAEKGVPEWFQGLDPLDPKINEILDLGLSIPLPKRDSQGRKIILVRGGHYDPKKYNLPDIMKASFVTSDVMVMDEVNQVHGFVLVQDMSQMGSGHILSYDRDTIKKSMRCWQDVYPTRNKSLNFCKMPTVVTGIMEICKLFMKEKTKKRLHFHSTWESLHEIVDKDVLPNEYGGTAGPIEKMIIGWKEHVVANRDEFLLNNQFGVDESKRPVPEPAADPNQGIVGTFRKLVL